LSRASAPQNASPDPLCCRCCRCCRGRPPNEAIGERACLNGEHCLARFVAQLRYGVETDMAFTCTEFLLPDAHRAFLDGKGLPARRGKCLMCCRYFMNYIYILARTRF
jgi:hypothetical protein